MESPSIGKWKAEVNNSGIVAELEVTGDFPTNGEAPVFHLEMNVPQGFNPAILLLTLTPNGIIDANGKGSGHVFEKFPLNGSAQYQSVQITDGKGSTIANCPVIRKPSHEAS